MARRQTDDRGKKDPVTGSREPRDGGKPSVTGEVDGDSTPASRRSVLKLAGVTAVGLGAAGLSGAATERHGISFDQVVDMVADAGCDPTGSRPCQDAIRQRAGNGRLLVFPSGTYRINGPLSFSGISNFGIVGEGDVTFKLDGGFQGWVPNVDDADNVLFENITIDQRAHNAIGWTRWGSNGYIRVQDITVVGAVEPLGRDNVKWRCLPFGRNSGARVVVKNFVARDGGMPGTYRNGGGGIFIGPSNRGTVKLIDCHMEGFPNNGVYAGRSRGPVQVDGGVFKNNEVAQLRLCGEGSYADGATIVVDKNDWGDGKLGNKNNALNMRGVWWESGRIGKTGGELRNLDIVLKSTVQTQGGIQVDQDGGACTITNCHIEHHLDGVPAIQAYAPTGGNYNPPPAPHHVHVQNTHITGSAANSDTVRIYDRDGSYVRDSCIHQSGASRDGVCFVRSNGDIQNTNIDVTGQAIDLRRSSVSTSGITHDATCTLRDPDSTGGTGDGSAGDGNDDGTPDDGPALDNVLTFGGGSASEAALYQFSVSGTIEENPGVGSINPEDAIDGSHARGLVEGGLDSYAFSGELTDLRYHGDLTATLNGEPVDLAAWESLDDTLTVTGHGEYAFEVSEAVQKNPNGGSVNPDDTVDGTHVDGLVAGGLDSYAFAGDIVDFVHDDGVSVRLNGEAVDPSQWTNDDGSSQLPNTIVFDATDASKRTRYTFRVTGAVEKDADAGTVDEADTIDGSRVDGVVEGDIDAYRFSGDLQWFAMIGDAAVNFEDTDG